MRGKGFAAAVLFALACLTSGGCMVTSSKYDMKSREADTLRDAYAAANKEKSALETKNEALSRQLSDEKETSASLSAKVRNQEEEIRRLSEELATARKSYEGTRITREQFITELLEKEKATGKRIQDLGEKAQSCEASLGALRKEASAREAELASLRKEVRKPDESEALRRERDILAGRVERLTEERKLEEKRRDERFAALSESLRSASPEVSVTTLGPALLVEIPEKALVAKSKGSLSGEGRKIAGEVGKAAAEFPGASVVLRAGGKKLAEELRDALVDGTKIPPERIFLKAGDREKSAELMLLVP